MGRAWAAVPLRHWQANFGPFPRAMAIVANHFIPPIPDIYNPVSHRHSSGL
jgi:hypothetical protein